MKTPDPRYENTPPHTNRESLEEAVTRDRAALAQSLDALHDRVGGPAIARDALGLLKANTAPFTASLETALRANPMAVALTGVGLAWLIFGGKKPKPASVTSAHEQLTRWSDDGGPVPTEDETADAWEHHAESLRSRAATALRRIEDAALSRLTPARDFAAERTAVLSEMTDGLKSVFRHGLDGLSSVAQDRIVKARQAAFSARLSAERRAEAATKMVEDHPLISGTISLALGAALAAKLPQTQTEDSTFGPQLDRLKAEARSLLAEERARATQTTQQIVAAGVAEVAGKVADRVLDSLISHVNQITPKEPQPAAPRDQPPH